MTKRINTAAGEIQDLLESVSVHAPGQWENETGPLDWYAVSTDTSGGIIAYFRDEASAFYFRLCLVNHALNGRLQL